MPGLKTLNKFGVPIYSTGGNPGKIGMLQPKMRHRFRVRVLNFGDEQKLEDLTRQVMSVTKPSLSYDIITVDSYNSRAYYSGKHTWGEINLTVRDDITNRVSRLIGQQVQKQLNHYEQTAWAAGINYKFNMYIEMLDGGNVKILEEWYLEGCFLSSINWNDLDYSSAEPQTISLTIRYDNAQYAGEDGLDRSVFPLLASNNFPGTSPGTLG